MNLGKREQKVPTEDELKEFELRKRAATQNHIPTIAYAERQMSPPTMSQDDGAAPSYSKGPLLLVAVIGFLLFLALGVLLYWVLSR